VPESGLSSCPEGADSGPCGVLSREGENKFYQIDFLQSKHPEIFGEI
jgi:hypothetical protein